MDLREVPNYLWVIVGILLVAIVVLLGIVVIWILRGKARIRTRWGEISADPAGVNAKIVASQTHNIFLASKIQCMLDRLPLIREAKWSSFLSDLKSKGVAVNFVNNEDAQFYYECLGNIVWSGNGIKSYMSIIQKAIADREFERTSSEAEFEAYIDDIMAQLRENENRYLDQRYQSTVVTIDGNYRTRAIIRDELYKLTDLQFEHTRKFVRDIFIHVRERGREERV